MLTDLGHEDRFAIRCPADTDGASAKGCQPCWRSAIDWHDVGIVASKAVAGEEDMLAIRADEWACIVGGVDGEASGWLFGVDIGGPQVALVGEDEAVAIRGERRVACEGDGLLCHRGRGNAHNGGNGKGGFEKVAHSAFYLLKMLSFRMGKFTKAAFASGSARASSQACRPHFRCVRRGQSRVLTGGSDTFHSKSEGQISFALNELLLHQDQRECLPKLAGDIFNSPTGDEGVSLVEVVTADVRMLYNKNELSNRAAFASGSARAPSRTCGRHFQFAHTGRRRVARGGVLRYRCLL